VLENQSVVAIFPTGAGKSLCYQLPAMLLPGMTLVVSPLLSLMKDQLDFLQANNINAYPYHAGMESVTRERIQNEFMNGTLNCVVATIAFGMGVDKEDIRRIIHYDLPKSIENYSQEIGRSGRDGRTALCEVIANIAGLPCNGIHYPAQVVLL
jgi:ATP-dependent DNA helicase RecQ